VGKAKNLRNRLHHYFSDTRETNLKTRLLLQEATQIEYVITESEVDALLLENQMIKNYQPRYNVLLKDGKTYPYICIPEEPFPRVFATRKKTIPNARYFGPYASVPVMKRLLRFFRDHFFIRTCQYDLSPEKIVQGNYRPCLEYHIKKCKAPCVGYITEEEYGKAIQRIIAILEGDFEGVIQELEQEKAKAVAEWNFERAQELKTLLTQLREHQKRSVVVSQEVQHAEVVVLEGNEQMTVAHHFHLQYGCIVANHTFVFSHESFSKEEEIWMSLLLSLQHRYQEKLSTYWLVNREVPVEIQERFPFVFEVPTEGDKARVVQMALKTAKQVLKERMAVRVHVDLHPGIQELQRLLKLPSAPMWIECFDNSHLQGHFPVSACVVFVNGNPEKKQYRHYTIENRVAQVPDDYAYMREVLFRRYSKLKASGGRLPDLIVLDGGKGQLNAGLQVLNGIGLSIPIISIAKRAEEIFLPWESEPLRLDRTSPALKLIQRMRNEAHNFALTFHRQQREKWITHNSLTDIPGIGEKTAFKLLSHFGSIDRVKKASFHELASVVGKTKAHILLRYWDQEENSDH
jgi:excinuclease ABC subunit C